MILCFTHSIVSVLQGSGYRHWPGVSGRSLAGLCHSPWPAVQGWVCSLPPPPGNSPYLFSKYCLCWKRVHEMMHSKLFNIYITCWYWLIREGLLITLEDIPVAAEGKFADDVSLSGLRVQSSQKRRLQIAIASTPWRDIQSHPGLRTSSLMTVTQNSLQMRQSTPCPVCIACLILWGNLFVCVTPAAIPCCLRSLIWWVWCRFLTRLSVQTLLGPARGHQSAVSSQ